MNVIGNLETNAKEVVLIYPHQLYESHPAIAEGRLHLVVEDPLFFGDYEYPLNFHKQKLILHRASMQWFAKEILGKSGYEYAYIEYPQLKSGGETFSKILSNLKKQGIQQVHIIDPTDYVLQKRICTIVKELGLDLSWYESPNFLSTTQSIDDYLSIAKDYFQTDFYKWQRRRLDVLLDEDGHPEGGKWTYDTDNRKKIPKQIEVPTLDSKYTKEEEPYVREAQKYVKKNFPENPGEVDEFMYCISHKAARSWFEEFIQERFGKFGVYQDAMTTRTPFVFHSVTSFALNIGLLDPHWMLEHTMQAAMIEEETPLQSIEGFVRQVIGWREFMCTIYLKEGSNIRTLNHFGHTRTIPKSFYTGNTGILPIDNAIKKTRRYAYAHHIERLMLLGNFMLLCEFNPNEVYNWFMELFIDSYDWVMVPNAYSMSQYADGGMIVTKPYISSSNYVKKMSDYTGDPKTEGNWTEVWDALYWTFIEKHKDEFKQNPRMSMMVNILDKKSTFDLENLHSIKEKFLKNL